MKTYRYVEKYSVSILLSITFLLVCFCVSTAFAVEGEILTPKEGESLNGVYEAEGTVRDLPAGHVLWLAVRKGKNFWPKDKAFVADGKKWTANIDESATQSGGSYSLVLFSVDQKGQAEIADWYRINDEQQSWPAMVGGINGGQALDSIKVNRK